MGSAAAWQLAKAGQRVTALERWRSPHALGSTHGETRVTRVTAWEGAEYVPLALRANALWGDLEQRGVEALRASLGGLFVGQPGDEIVAGSLASARRSGADLVELDAEAVSRALPGLRVHPRWVGVRDPGAGILHPEAILRALHAAASGHGADLRWDEPLRAWEPEGAGVRVTTASGSFTADRLILALGAWMGPHLAPLGVPLRIERQTMHWFDASRAPEEDARRPVLIASDGSDHATVIFPVKHGLVKVAGHGRGEAMHPDHVDREIHAADVAPAEAALADLFPGRYGAHRRAATCLYSRTPDGHFIIDRHPELPQVILASPCNGFGFKFSSAVGEALACVARDATPPVAIDRWRIRR
jgi:sarcosine oxidase